jgi:hypothetical protein
MASAGISRSRPYFLICKRAENTGTASGPNIYCSTNGGVNFFIQHVSPFGATYRHLSIVLTASDNLMSIITGYGVTSDGVISHYNETVGIPQIGSSIPESFKLEQNYPNPFNPVTNFGFQIADFGFVSIKIYDAAGKEIAIIINGEMQPGVYEADWMRQIIPAEFILHVKDC